MKKLNDKKGLLVKGIIWVIVVAVLWNLPPSASGTLTKAGVHNLAVFVGLILGMCTMPYMIPIIACLILMAVSGVYDGFMSMMFSSFGSNNVIICVALFFFAGVLNKSGLASYIATKIISSKAAAGRPWALTFFILLATSVTGLLLHPMIVIVIMLDIVVVLFKELDLKKGNKWAIAIMLVVVDIPCMMQCTMPYQMSAAVDYGVMSNFDPNLAMDLNIAPHLASSIILDVLFFGISFLFVYLLGRKDIRELYDYKPPKETVRLNEDQKYGMIILVVFLILLLSPIFMPACALKTFLNSTMAVSGIAFGMTAVALCIFKKDGTPLMTSKQVVDAGVNWDVVMMMAAIAAISGQMTSEVTGVTAWLSEIMMPVVSKMPPYGVFVVLIIFALIGTNLTANAAIAYICMPIIYTICSQMGIPVAGVFAMCLHSYVFGIWTPSSSPYAAVLYGRTSSGYIKAGDILKYNLIMFVVFGALMLSVGWLCVEMF